MLLVLTCPPGPGSGPVPARNLRVRRLDGPPESL